MTSNGKDGYYGFGLNTDSGNFLNAATSIENKVARIVAEATFKNNKIALLDD